MNPSFSLISSYRLVKEKISDNIVSQLVEEKSNLNSKQREKAMKEPLTYAVTAIVMNSLII